MKAYLPGLREEGETVDVFEFNSPPPAIRRFRIYLRLWRWHIPLGTIKSEFKR